jgi:uncharacterized protein
MKKMIYAIIAMFSLQVMAEFVVPATPHPVNDYAGILSEGDKNSIAHQLILLRDATGAQGGVLIVNSLDGTDISEASMKVAEAWKLGAKDADSGVLLMLSIADHKSRLEIGKGLEGMLTDADSKRILAGMRAGLRSGDYGRTIGTAIGAVSSTIVAHKEEIMTKPVGAEAGGGFALFFGIIGFGGLFAYIMYLFMGRKKKKVEDVLPVGKTFVPYTPANVEKSRYNKHVTTDVPAKKTSSDTYIVPVVIPTSRDHDYDSGSSFSSSSSSDYSSSSDNSSSWSGGGGDFSGGGSSDSW